VRIQTAKGPRLDGSEDLNPLLLTLRVVGTTAASAWRQGLSSAGEEIAARSRIFTRPSDETSDLAKS